jgi:hypothetical protein
MNGVIFWLALAMRECVRDLLGSGVSSPTHLSDRSMDVGFLMHLETPNAHNTSMTRKQLNARSIGVTKSCVGLDGVP